MAEKQTSKDRMREIVDSIENGIKELFESDKYQQYLATMSRFHRYSVNNTMLIYMQRPDATHVAGFNKWRDQFGRNVLKGEKGIRIIAPTPYKKKVEEIKTDPETNAPVLDADGKAIIEEKEIRIPMFKVVSVFDVSQTAGKPLPQLAADLSGNVQEYEVFMEALRRTSPVPMEIKPVARDTDGFFSIKAQSITIRAGMSEVQTVCAAVHEIAHAKLHDYEHMTELADDGETILVPGEKSRNTEEVEAESISYAVCQYYGIETGENSFGYIATWSKGKELKELRASLETINKTASELITDIDRHFAEICKERGIDRENLAAAEQSSVEAPEAEKLYMVDNDKYIHVQRSDTGIDYTIYDAGSAKVLDGGVLDGTEQQLPTAALEICKLHNIGGAAPIRLASLELLKDLQEANELPLGAGEQITGAVAVPTDAADNMLPELEQAVPIMLFQVGDFFEIYGEDAKQTAELLDLNLTTREIPGAGRVEMCGVPSHNLEMYVEKLRDKYDVTIAEAPDFRGERHIYTLRSIDHEAEAAINAYEAEFGADGTRVFRDPAADVPQPTVRELFDGYKLTVGNALSKDTAFVNACRNSDRQNAYLEGADAIRRIVTASDDLQLVRLYFDMPAFHNRLHQELLEELYPTLAATVAPSPYQITQEDIDNALLDWHNNLKGKQEVALYMQAHGRERSTAAWLAAKYGWDDSKTPMYIHVGNAEPVTLTWAQVQRRLAQLIRENKFYDENERLRLFSPDRYSIRLHPGEGGITGIWDEVLERFCGDGEQTLRFAEQNNAIAYLDGIKRDMGIELSPPAFTTPLGYTYHIGDRISSIELDHIAAVGVIARVDEDHVWHTLPNVPGQEPVSIDRNSFERYLDTRYFEVSEPEPQRVIAAQHTEQPTPETPQAVQNLMGQRVEIDGKLYNVDSADETIAHLSVVSSSSESNHDPEHRTEPVSAVLTRIADQGRELAPNISAYQALRAEHPEKLIGVRVGERLLFYDADAERAASALNRRLLQRDIPGMGETAVTGYDFGQWASAAKRLLEHGHSFVFAQPNETDGYDVFNEADAKEYIPIGMELEIDGRKFVIDSVNFSTDEVSLRDVTFQNRQGFPIFRAEHIAFIRSFVEEQEREQPQPVTKPVAFYPAEKTHLPYDIEIQTLHIPEPEHDPPSAEPAEPEPPAMSDEERLILEQEGRAALSEMGEFVPDFDDAISQAEIDEPPAHRPAVSIPVDGEWQGFPSIAAAEQAAYADFKAASHRDAQNFHITDDALGVGGAKAKFRANMAAIQLLQELEFEGLQASPEQQEILSRYVGWGGLADAFDENKPNWSDEFAELYATLSPEEYAAARASTLNAHYTSPTVIKAIYEAVGNMGFQTGNILEPSMGVGNFFGLLPEQMQGSKLYGVELDSITGRIAKQLSQSAATWMS